MSRERILHIIPSLGFGGAEQLLCALLPALKDRGYECSLAVLWGPYDLEARLEQKGVPVHRLEVGHRWNLAEGTWCVSRLIHELQPDIVHSHLFFATLYTGLSRSFHAGVQRVVTFHNLAYAASPPTTPWKKLRRAFHGKVVRDTFEAATAVSQEVADHHWQNLGRTISRVIPNAVNLGAIEQAETDHPAEPSQRWATETGLEIISPGRLAPEKGHHYLVQAFPILLKDEISPRLTIFGRGPLHLDLQTEIDALGLTDRIQIHHPIPQEQLFHHILDADVVLFPSTHEGFGIGAAEAMALGRPVIASRVGGLKEIIEHEKTGLLVDPGDSPEIASAIQRIAAAPEFASEIGRRAREHARSQFGPAAVAQQYEEFYETILGS